MTNTTDTTDTAAIAAMYPVMMVDTITVGAMPAATWQGRRGTRATVAQQYYRHVAGVLDAIRTYAAPADLAIVGGENETYLDWTDPDGRHVSRVIAVRPAD